MKSRKFSLDIKWLLFIMVLNTSAEKCPDVLDRMQKSSIVFTGTILQFLPSFRSWSQVEDLKTGYSGLVLTRTVFKGPRKKSLLVVEGFGDDFNGDCDSRKISYNEGDTRIFLGEITKSGSFRVKLPLIPVTLANLKLARRVNNNWMGKYLTY